jgi:hypothetical protein
VVLFLLISLPIISPEIISAPNEALVHTTQTHTHIWIERKRETEKTTQQQQRRRRSEIKGSGGNPEERSQGVGARTRVYKETAFFFFEVLGWLFVLWK